MAVGRHVRSDETDGVCREGGATGGQGRETAKAAAEAALPAALPLLPPPPPQLCHGEVRASGTGLARASAASHKHDGRAERRGGGGGGGGGLLLLFAHLRCRLAITTVYMP